MLSDAKENSKTQETIERLMRENQELKQQLALVLESLSTLTAAPPASSPPLSISPSVIEPDMAAESGTDIIDFSPQPAKKKKGQSNPRMILKAPVKEFGKNTGNSNKRLI